MKNIRKKMSIGFSLVFVFVDFIVFFNPFISVEITVFLVAALIYNRLLLGILIYISKDIKIEDSETINLIFRGAIIGFLVSIGLIFSLNDLFVGGLLTINGIIYGIAIEFTIDYLSKHQ
jgi:hypothetical protein